MTSCARPDDLSDEPLLGYGVELGRVIAGFYVIPKASGWYVYESLHHYDLDAWRAHRPTLMGAKCWIADELNGDHE